MFKTIEFQNVSKSFKNKSRVLNNLNFICNSEETYFLFGNTGSGKTTIIDMLLTDISPNLGNIFICGDDIAKFNQKQKQLYLANLGIIWQSIFLIDYKTIFENIAMPLVLKSEKSKIIKEKVLDILESAKLTGIKDLFAKDLTLSQKQMVCILRALIHNPKIIVADEPMNHLDFETEDLVMNLIEKYKHPNATILLATSQKYLLERFASSNNEKTKVLILEDGKIR